VYPIVPPEETPPTSAVSHVNPAVEFAARLHAITPRVFVAFAFLGLNVLVFLAMIATGVSTMEPTTHDLLRWGADFGPSTITGGQWWRLFSSMFLHIGIVHLAFNMFVLYQIGPFVERLVGNGGFFIAYLVSGLIGGLASLAWDPYAVGAGASGAIFGLYGVLLGFLMLSERESIPAETLASLQKSALIFIGYNVVFGVLHKGTDLAAHAGGLIAGFFCGLVLSIPLTVSNRRKRVLRNAIVAIGGTAITVAAALAVPRPVDLRAEVKNFAGIEKKTLDAYSEIFTRARTEKLTGDQMADAIEKDVLPDWMREHDSLAKLKKLPENQERLVSSLMNYMELRQQGWTITVQGLRRNNVNLLQQGGAKQHEADEALKKIGL
jgi:rhomboid protease GluP